jgi:putative DNA primase/helicase
MEAKGVGRKAATEAARAVSGRMAIPGDEKDFNDLHQRHGLEAVKKAVEAAKGPPGVVQQATVEGASEPASSGSEWPEPQELVSTSETEPYPITALPSGICAAVMEVVEFVQCPPSLAACSALSVLSVVGQGLVNVQRADRLAGPSGLYLMAVADSGERKTTCDGYFKSAVEEWEREQAEAAKPALVEFTAEMQAWEAKRDGLKAAIKKAAQEGESTEEHEAALRELEKKKPIHNRTRRLLRVDTTPEALAWNLSQEWPSGGVLSSEAGIVFGGQGMSRESLMRNMALLNILWDGGTLTVDRRSKESFVVRGARLTVGLAVQPETVRAFFDSTRGLARGSGFAARFLIAWPESTQGTRLFKQPTPATPATHGERGTRRVATVATVAVAAESAPSANGPNTELSPVQEIRRQRALELLAASPGLKRAVVVDEESESDQVIFTVAIWGLGTCDVCIPRTRFDPFLLIELVERHGAFLH